MRMRFAILPLTLVIALTGCGGASVSESQCIASDWQTVGYRDGSNGYASSRLLAHQDACVKHGVIPDRTGYMAGWEQGIRRFCRPNNGFAVGERGAGYGNVCPADLEADFLAAYREGRTLHSARVEVANLERLINQHYHRLEQVKAEIVSTAAEQLNPELTPAQRIELIALTGRLADEKAQIEVELPDLERELEHKRLHLDELSRSLAAVAY